MQAIYAENRQDRSGLWAEFRYNQAQQQAEAGGSGHGHANGTVLQEAPKMAAQMCEPGNGPQHIARPC